MRRISTKILSVLIIVVCTTILQDLRAQYTLSSPYSRFGIGYKSLSSNQTSYSMGGVGYAFARNNEVNILNPASLFEIQKESFVFNMGFDLNWRNLSSSNKSSNAFVASITNISLAFPIFDRWKIGLTLSPFTDIDYLGSDTILSTINRVKTFEGNGGVDRFTASVSYQPVKSEKHNLSLGANFTYYFGNIYRSSSLSFLTQRDSVGVLRDTTGFFDNSTEKNYDVSSIGIDFGLQYFYNINNDDRMGIGLTFTPKYKLHTTKKQMFYTCYTYSAQDYIQDTLSYSEKDVNITMPMKLGVGISYERKNKLFAEMDFTYTQWSDFDFEMQTENSLKDNWQLNLGLEYTPDAGSAMYYKKIAYRFGIYYDNGYIYLQDNRIKDYGITFGMALPIKKLGTKVNLSFGYGRQGTTDNSLIKEDYLRIGMSLSAKDRWFVKRKYQ
jgi:long-subunit fatty acid transport protein